jgi:hypothetical protein
MDSQKLWAGLEGFAVVVGMLEGISDGDDEGDFDSEG